MDAKTLKHSIGTLTPQHSKETLQNSRSQWIMEARTSEYPI